MAIKHTLTEDPSVTAPLLERFARQEAEILATGAKSTEGAIWPSDTPRSIDDGD